jgi:hypothetical protein
MPGEMTTLGSQDHLYVTGKLNGDGPTVRVETMSGDVQVH